MKKLLLLAALAVCGCANIETVSLGDDRLDAARGYALVSLSHSGYGWLESLTVTYRQKGGTIPRQIGITPRDLFSNPDAGVLLRDTERRMIGELKLLSLPPGDYEFISWSALASRGNVGLTIVTTTWRPVDPPPPLLFSVKAGQITYVGNLDILIPSEKRYRWRGLDERARDLPLFEKRFVGAKQMSSDVRLMQSSDPSAAEFEGAANQ